jgi:hypothetical protein
MHTRVHQFQKLGPPWPLMVAKFNCKTYFNPPSTMYEEIFSLNFGLIFLYNVPLDLVKWNPNKIFFISWKCALKGGTERGMCHKFLSI